MNERILTPWGKTRAVVVTVPDSEMKDFLAIWRFLVAQEVGGSETRAGLVRGWLRELARLKGYNNADTGTVTQD